MASISFDVAQKSMTVVPRNDAGVVATGLGNKGYVDRYTMVAPRQIAGQGQAVVSKYHYEQSPVRQADETGWLSVMGRGLEMLFSVILLPLTIAGCESEWSGSGEEAECSEGYHKETCERTHGRDGYVTSYSCCKDDNGCGEGTYLGDCVKYKKYSDEAEYYKCCLQKEDNSGDDGGMDDKWW